MQRKSSDLFQSLADFKNDCVFVGEATRLQLAIDQLTADRQLKAAAGRGLECQAGDAPLELVEELVRQTDGLWLVVSHRAVTQM
jgi:hypothetical protein